MWAKKVIPGVKENYFFSRGRVNETVDKSKLRPSHAWTLIDPFHPLSTTQELPEFFGTPLALFTNLPYTT